MAEGLWEGRLASFITGGLVPLLILGLFAVAAWLLDDYFYANTGAIVLFFLVGGVVGLIVHVVYNKGFRAGQRSRTSR